MPSRKAQTVAVSLDDILTGSVTYTHCTRCSQEIAITTPSMADLTQTDDAASRYTKSLTPAEARIFNCLFTSLGQFLDVRRITLGSWGPEYLRSDYLEYAHLLRVNIARIRPKLVANGALFSIENEPGRGYRLVANQAGTGTGTAPAVISGVAA